MLLYDEYRRAVSDGKVQLNESDFITDFGKRSFKAIMELEKSDGGFLFALLGESFNADELGRLAYIEQKRREVTKNDLEVLEASVRTLKAQNDEADSDDWMTSLRKKQGEAKQRRDGVSE